MNDDVQLYLDDAEEKMDGIVNHLEKELVKIRAGKANPHILDGILVNYYGTETPLNRVANISISDARTLIVQPWDKNVLDAVEKAIMKANVGLTPMSNGEIIRLNIPVLTEERRRDIVKQVKHLGEAGKIGVRNIRREAIDDIKKLQKDGLEEDEAKNAELLIQKLTDKYIDNIDKLLHSKEKEVMTV
jgi:ribosome recycling factor